MRTVAFAIDEAYVPFCAAAIRSLLDHHGPDEVDLHVVHDGSLHRPTGARLRRWLADAGVSATFHTVGPSRLAGLPSRDRFGAIVWSRLLLPELLADRDRVLYLDADVLVTGRLDELWDTDLEGVAVGAVRNVVERSQRDRLRRLGIDDLLDVLNSGVLLFDLEALRARPLLPVAREVLARFGDQIRWPDQDVLNVVYADAWTPLDPRYNVMNSFYDWEGATERVLGTSQRRSALAAPAVLHFEGPTACKPWHVLSSHPFRDRYREVLSRTAWSDVSLDGDDRTTRLLARLPQSVQLPLYEQLVLVRRGARPSLRGLARTVRRRRRELDSVR